MTTRPDVGFIVPVKTISIFFYFVMMKLEIIQNCKTFLKWNPKDIRGSLKELGITSTLTAINRVRTGSLAKMALEILG